MIGDKRGDVGRRRARTRRHRSLTVVSLVVALGAAACVPPTPTVPAPDLPAGVGVRWLRDTGGTIDGDDGAYSPAPDAYTLLDGTVVGPDPVDPLTVALPPTWFDLGDWSTGSRTAPDGTARLPWNGFAGEGITLVITGPYQDNWTLEFPGGSCSLGTVGQYYLIQMVSPSPDGTKVAVRSYDNDGRTTIAVMSLADGAACPTITYAGYQAQSSRWAGTVLVWAPDSSALAYRIARGGEGTGIAALEASPGAVPVDVIAPTNTAGGLTPLGWSVDDRLLYTRLTLEDGSPVSRLVTRAVTGGPERVIDTATLPTAVPGYLSPLTIAGLHQFLHYGYFVPGTTTIVYQHGSSSVTDGDGYTFPRFYVARKADADNAASAPIGGSVPPLTWHQEALADKFFPPFNLIDVPDAEFIDRFVH